ncbi:FAD-dependent 2-octaprenylphenol hydroxylase [Alteromonas sediminis]|uniref:FAD-dependent 2-octaprenylphenol hydroxylase n=1 Tax=Alteromonas sediminis TaxID=2259342 RepID=A0A3N5Y2B4_9ALTE|nr:FAD-dependent monooxygenase [Alteromonas sediminis]RPJ67987.1 FAD-dependent 2-octaprenylphenol hydroxylase [Alteromonas sediminis]
MQHFDISIVGAGMVGLALARALAPLNKRIALIGAEPLTQSLPTEPTLRVSAINLHNQSQLEALNVWQHLDTTRTCTYDDMLVWEARSFGKITFTASEANASHLGTIVENQALVNALAKEVLTQSNVQVFDAVSIDKLSLGEKQHAIVLSDEQMLSTDFIVGADGGQSLVRKIANFPLTFRDYGQQAIVATIKTTLPHENCARQVFTEHGPLALLPLGDPHLCSIVWSQTTKVSEALLVLDEDAFNKALMVTSDQVLGKIRLASERRAFPLKMQYARKWLDNNLVLCGDAAHTIHPLAGQGVNLGFGDVWHLADYLLQNGDLRQYERSRKTHAVKTIAAMEGFHQLFTGSHPLKKLIRSSGLSLVNKQDLLKGSLLSQALGV